MDVLGTLKIPKSARAGNRLGSDASGNVAWGGSSTLTKFIQPAIYTRPLVEGVLAPTINLILAVRVIVPEDGFLRDVSWYAGAVSGNCIMSAYDTGDASAGNRSRLATSGSKVIAGGNTWQTWDPGASALAVVAGQQLDLAVSFDNTTVTYGRGGTATNNAALQLPTNFDIVTGGASPKLVWTNAPGSFTHPATIAEASCSAGGTPPVLIARVA